MEEETDDRGVLRGGCTVCECLNYNRGDTGRKCATCSHPPGRHQNLSLVKGAPLQPICKFCNKCFAGEGFPYCSPECRDEAMLPTYNDEMKRSIKELKKTLQLNSVAVKVCVAHSCHKVVYYDDNGMDFDYCSPECRDQHRLEEYNNELFADIAKFEKELSQLRQSQHTHQGSYDNDTPVDPPRKRAQTKSTSRSKELEVRCNRSAKNDQRDKQQPSLNEIEMSAISSSSQNTSSTQPSRKKKSPRRMVTFHKTGGEHGIVVYNGIWSLRVESVVITGYLITGTKVDKNLEFFKKMQGCEVQLLDIIVKVGDQTTDGSTGDLSQETLDKRLSELDNITLDIYRPEYAQPTGKIISLVLDKNPSHIVAVVNSELMCFPPSKFDLGMEIQQDDTILLTDEEADVLSVASTCGLKSGDKYVASVINSASDAVIQKNYHFKKNKPSLPEIQDDFKTNSLIFSVTRCSEL